MSPYTLLKLTQFSFQKKKLILFSKKKSSIRVLSQTHYMDEPNPSSHETESSTSEQEHNLKKIEDLKRIRQELTQSIETQLREFYEEESDKIQKINIYLSSINFKEDQLKLLFPEHLITPKRMMTTIDLGEFRSPFVI